MKLPHRKYIEILPSPQITYEYSIELVQCELVQLLIYPLIEFKGILYSGHF
jgi:hypothetical protein